MVLPASSILSTRWHRGWARSIRSLMILLENHSASRFDQDVAGETSASYASSFRSFMQHDVGFREDLYVIVPSVKWHNFPRV